MRPRPQHIARSRPRMPRGSARLRLTALFGILFLVSGAALLVVTYLLVDQATEPGGSVSPGLIGPAVGPSSGEQVSLSGDGSPQQISAAQTAAVGRVVRAILGELLMRSPVALAIVTVVAVALGWAVAGRILRPLATITAAARRISASNLNERLSLQGPDDELKALGDTLDDLFTRLEAAFEAQRHFVANASHELRTPLTRERAMLQVALDDPATTAETWRCTTRDVLASNAEQENLIESLLTLASSEGGLNQREPLDLAVITNAALLARCPEISRLGLHLQVTSQPTAAMDGDPLLTERLVANLIDNAARHNFAGGRVEITTATRDGCAVLSVANTGSVIPAAEIGRLFQPFQRLSAHRVPSRGGHGLGLSIVRAIADAHHAAITARPLPGGGLCVQITFPPVADSPAAPATGSNATPQNLTPGRSPGPGGR
jgi:signal transduction histidine kinase